MSGPSQRGPTRSERYLEALRVEFPRLRLVKKADDPLSRWLDRLLRVVTFGAQAAYLTRYTTVIAHTIYTPLSWETRSDDERYITLRHEAVHLRQTRRLGMVRMALYYGVVFLPVGLAYGRARIEWEAYADTLRANAEVYGLAHARSPALREHIVQQFTSAAYLWMWPFPAQVHRWIDEELARIGGEGGPEMLPGGAPETVL